MEGARVADIGSGDGFIDLGLLHRWKPASLTGFDVHPTTLDRLAEMATEHGVEIGESPGLTLLRSDPTHLPAESDSFDLVVSWSAFEHVADPCAMLKEVRRVLKPEGSFFCQIRPLYFSRHGSHLERWFPEGWVHLSRSPEEIRAAMVERDPDHSEIERMSHEFQILNRITLDVFGEHLGSAGFDVVRLELESGCVEIPPSLSQRTNLSALAIDGFKLLAR